MTLRLLNNNAILAILLRLDASFPVCLSIDGELSENNLQQDPEISPTMIKALADIRFRLSSIVIEEVTRLKEIQFPNMKKNENGKWDAHWYEIALFQEITVILRRQRLAGAIETARFAIDFLNIGAQTDSDGGNQLLVTHPSIQGCMVKTHLNR